MAEKGRRWKMKNQRFLFKNLVTKAMKEEIENKNSPYILDYSCLNVKPLQLQSKVETLTAKALNRAIEFY